MGLNQTSLPLRLKTHWTIFSLALVLMAAAYVVYGLNLIWWCNSPDFGWRTMYDSGPNVVAQVFDLGESAGLRVGDRVVAINGQQYNTFADLFFKIRNSEHGSVNTYSVARGGQTLQISIETGRLGFRGVLVRSGPLFFIGLLYVFLGILVFLMKPQAAESWLFLVMTCLFGMELSFFAPSDLIRPLRFYNVRLLNDVFLAAPMIHLALIFPKPRSFLQNRAWLAVFPYLPSAALFIGYKVTSQAYWHSSPLLNLMTSLYITTGVMVFLSSVAWNSLRDTSNVIRLQSQVILTGIVLAFFLPVANHFALSLRHTHLFPNPALVFALCLLMFPLSIGYTIVKHDLFAIDVIVRRTYGYILSTGSIVGTYCLIVLLLNVTFRSSEVSRSPVFSIVFALGVVFFFRPLHERFQALVDRVFYRRQYDYRKTIKDTSEAMISILDPGEIHRKLIGSVVREMFLENGLLLVPDQESHAYRTQVVEGDDGSRFQSVQLGEHATLTQLLKEKKDAIFRYEADLNPGYRIQRESMKQTFDSLHSELVLPLTYKDEMRGIVSLGRKKSGKMFTLEDLDLLKTITNHSSIALENARLFEENIEKSRMEEELKIARDLQASMLPEKAPAMEGFSIAATSIPAREVGGDFYDFIAAGGDGKCERLGIIVGDVSGKAVSGALVMAASRSIFRVLTEANASVKEVMSIGNARLIKDVKKGMFVALLYAVLDSRERALVLSNAGQTQPILCSCDNGEPRYVETQGDTFPLGILRESDYQETCFSLRRGDTLVIYTDGVVEAKNDREELYGFDRLLLAIGEGRHLGAEELMSKLMDDVMNFVGGIDQHDDLTIVVVKVQ
jgi:serine phosphatase RsbU (regulator of sigma subunit)